MLKSSTILASVESTHEFTSLLERMAWRLVIKVFLTNITVNND